MDENLKGRLQPHRLDRARMGGGADRTADLDAHDDRNEGLRRIDSKNFKALGLLEANLKPNTKTTTTSPPVYWGVLLLLLSKLSGCGHIVTTRLLLRLGYFTPANLAVLRNVVTVFFLGALLLLKSDLRKNLKHIAGEVRSNWRSVVPGAAGTFVLQTLVMQSLDLIPATNLAVLSLLSPPFLFVIAGFILKTERPTWVRFAGMVAAVAGAVVIIDPTGFEAGDAKATVGNLLCAGTALCYAIIVTVQKHLVASVPAAALQFTFTAYAFPFFVLLAACFGDLGSMALTAESAGGAAIVGVFASLDYYFAFASLKYVSTLLVGLSNSLLPLFVGIATYFVNGERLSWKDLVGAALILAGMVTVIAAKTEQVERAAGRGGGDDADGKALLELDELDRVSRESRAIPTEVP